eukprot:CAMPEP_0197876728 /NCGR_PEP_ID=MMETSP1439-20131203/5633_1 /TAXON_ID=66791 /ORGANISM="Gonyaulax spinifera, Strain CCMP409" /LENGTH=62 /DNA_ID=CAMNT_0043496027 /DNA_START=127 /DNA_END=312 /DNA_ORIENTATION=-
MTKGELPSRSDRPSASMPAANAATESRMDHWPQPPGGLDRAARRECELCVEAPRRPPRQQAP